MDNLFEIASRKRLTIATNRGNLGVDDLWDLPLTSAAGKVNLDEVARGLHTRINASAVSFVETAPSAVNENERIGFEIVKHIIAVRLEENKKAAEARVRKEQKERILELLAKREDEKLASKSEDELRALLATI